MVCLVLKSAVLPNATLFSYMISWGELLVGIALILGCFTSFSVLTGIVMNLTYLLARVSGPNPLMLVCGFCTLFGGYNAARVGLDYWITPWYKQIQTRSMHPVVRELSTL